MRLLILMLYQLWKNSNYTVERQGGTLIGMWETGGIYVCLYQSAGGGNDVLLYRTVRHCRDYKGGYNRFLSRRDLEGGSYAHLLETLSRLRKDRVDNNERAA